MKQIKFTVQGKVQKVMFRQTLMRAALKYGVQAAASNDSRSRDLVSCYLEGEASACELIIDRLKSGMKLNSWGATVEAVSIVAEGVSYPLSDFQVSTANVDEFNWTEGVEFYL